MSDLNESHPMDVISTSLGAHAVPFGFAGRTDDYVDYIIEGAFPTIQTEHTVTFCDVLYEKDVFSLGQSERLLRAACHHHFKLKMHVDEIVPSGGAELTASLKCVSADRLLHILDTDTKCLVRAGVVATLPPLTVFSLNEPYAPARKMTDVGCAVALASDLNPGNCFSAPIPMMIALACVHTKMIPKEVAAALTISGATVMGCASEIGSTDVGECADVILLKYPSYGFLPYHMRIDFVDTVIRDGELYMI